MEKNTMLSTLQKTKFIFILAIAPLLLLPMGASAVTYNFLAIPTTGTATDRAIGEAQFSLTVTGTATSTSFTFHNLAGQQSDIANIYFYQNGAILPTTLPTIMVSGGATIPDFGLNDSNPAKLPAAVDWGLPNPALVFDSGAHNPKPKYGLNEAADSVTFTFAANESAVLAALNLPSASDHFPAGSLVIGLHAIAFADGESVSFVTGQPPVPLPPSVLLMGSGLLGLILIRRKKFGRSPRVKS